MCVYLHHKPEKKFKKPKTPEKNHQTPNIPKKKIHDTKIVKKHNEKKSFWNLDRKINQIENFYIASKKSPKNVITYMAAIRKC